MFLGELKSVLGNLSKEMLIWAEKARDSALLLHSQSCFFTVFYSITFQILDYRASRLRAY